MWCYINVPQRSLNYNPLWLQNSSLLLLWNLCRQLCWYIFVYRGMLGKLPSDLYNLIIQTSSSFFFIRASFEAAVAEKWKRLVELGSVSSCIWCLCFPVCCFYSFLTLTGLPFTSSQRSLGEMKGRLQGQRWFFWFLTKTLHNRRSTETRVTKVWVSKL